MRVEDYRKIVAKEKTASDITKSVLDYYPLCNCDGWRHNNIAVRGRKFIGRYGVFDVTGICLETGKWVAVETKTVKDKPSKDQLEFQRMIRAAGGVAEFAGTDFIEFKKSFDEALKQIRKQ